MAETVAAGKVHHRKPKSRPMPPYIHGGKAYRS